MKRFDGYTVLEIFAGNASLALVDSATFGLGAAFRNSMKESAEHIRQCNDALYQMRIATFLETVELCAEEVEFFLNENTDHLKLGLGIIRELETFLCDKQAEMSAINFRLLVQGKVDKPIFYKIQHVISRLNEYLLSQIERIKPDLSLRCRIKDEYAESYNDFFDLWFESETEHLKFQSVLQGYYLEEFQNLTIAQEFVGFEFLQQKANSLNAGQTQEHLLTYVRTNFFLWFYFKIYNLK